MAEGCGTRQGFVLPLERVSQSEEETVALGAELGALLGAGDVVALFGELGAGKTKFIQGVCEGLGVKRFVCSPSFVLINEYRGRLPVYHFDFYRIRDQEELAELGLEEYFYGEGVCLVEWAERALHLLPEERVEVMIATCSVTEPTCRRIVIRRVDSGASPSPGRKK
ncbi:MAG: tRNA (adenosine(37)-N6)-threonylcarbamoyltransferase complex ATPase subunit type 1 TsaE [candidate division KSB1 bacterium]|nr:tRNA (adenosine(37)-N6)-threonylcarbamoyltransferase complex ATPase subunit type 1 TsaE [candidate division KSB1 bacterium]